MTVQTKHLPQDTRSHLFSLVTDPVYRSHADSASYDFAPRKDGEMGSAKGRGESVKKYGYTAHLAAGTASRRGGPDPGRYRLLAFSQPVAGPTGRVEARTTWWKAIHTPANTYKFEKIVFPTCKTCSGTADVICGRCGGSGRLPETIYAFAGPCTTCGKKGFASCASCAPTVVVDGKAISRTFADWS